MNCNNNLIIIMFIIIINCFVPGIYLYSFSMYFKILYLFNYWIYVIYVVNININIIINMTILCYALEIWHHLLFITN